MLGRSQAKSRIQAEDNLAVQVLYKHGVGTGQVRPLPVIKQKRDKLDYKDKTNCTAKSIQKSSKYDVFAEKENMLLVSKSP